MKKYLKLATLFVAAVISVAVVSCQKDKETEEPVASQSQNSEAKELLNRIYAFQELRDDINSGAKSGESMTLEELRDNIDLTFNFEHSQHATPFDYATLDTFYVRMPQTDANGNVSAADAIATYNAFETSLENLLANVEDDSNLAKNFSIKFPETGAKNEDAIQVVFTRGAEGEKYPLFEPFEEWEDYIWANNGGLCNPQGPFNIQTDAAQELTKKLDFKIDADHEGMTPFLYNLEYVNFTPYQDSYYFPDYIYVDYNIFNMFWIFCIGGDLNPEDICIEDDELNGMYNRIYSTHIYINSQYHYSPNNHLPYLKGIIDPHVIYDNVSKRPIYLYTLTAIYGHYSWIDNANDGNNTPVN